MTARPLGPRPKVVIAGSGFGRVYLAAVTAPGAPYELAGILARGSARSRACAEHYGVPLLESVDQVGDDVALAGVAVGSAMTGGPGAEIAAALLERGIHVLHEHPVHPDEVTTALRIARRVGAAYRVNTLHVDTVPVQAFLTAAAQLLDRQRVAFVEVSCAIQTGYATLDVLARLLGGLRPWRLTPLSSGADPSDRPPYVTVEATLAGTPVVLRIQDDVDADRPDNHLRQLLRITVATAAGQLSLIDSAGPVVWAPQAHLAPDTDTAPDLAASAEPGYAAPVFDLLGGPAPTRSALLGRIWPDALRLRFDEMVAAVRAGDPTPAREAQRQLTLAQAANDLARSVPARVVAHPDPELLSAREVFR